MTPSTATNTRARPLRMRLLLLAASGLVPLVMLLAWGIDHLVQERRDQSERLVLELSRALATAIDAELRSIEVLLDHMGNSDELERADLRAFHQSAQRTAEQLGWRQVMLSDAEGRSLFRTSEPYGKSDQISLDPKSLDQVIATLKPYVSEVISTPRFKSDAFAVRVPVLRGGKLVYVLTAVLPTESMSAVLTRQNIPAGLLSTVFDQAQYRVARSRPAPSPHPTPSLKALLDGTDPQGVGRTVTREGTDSYTGFTRLKSGWVVVVGTSVDDAHRGLRALFSAVAIGLAASLALSVVLAWLLSRRVLGPIEALKDAAAALGRGDPVKLPPLHIVELDGVAIALAEAAADRDRATQERQRAMQERERVAAERETMAAQVAEALRAAEEANRSKDQFLAVLGHELRNPLAPIMNAVQLMALKGDGKTAQERRIIERQLVHVTRLVDDLLDVSRITGGRLTIRREPVRLAHLLAQLVDTIQPSLHQRTLTLELKPGMETAWVSGDEVRLVQVFNNLLVNAIKFTPAGGTVRVRAAVSGEQVQVDVEDTGIGISQEELRRVFDLFYQAPQSSDRARGGLGLGLPIVRSLVEMHGGTTLADSAGAGQGSCFTVRLAMCEAPAAAEPLSSQPAADGSGNILVVDDNEDAADTCATLLELNGYVVRVAYTPEAALDTLRDFAPDLAILDIGLPRMSGYELARAMRAAPHGFQGALLALTGYGQATDRSASEQAGFNGHVTKPVSPEIFLRLIARLLRQRSGAGTQFVDSSADST